MATMQAWASQSEAIDRARGSDPAALEALLAAAWPHAFRIALSILRHPMAAEDAAQEACARMLRAIGSLRSTAAFGVWFYRLVVREALALERRHRIHDPLDAADLASASSLTDALVRIDVLRALGSLPPRQRAVVALHYYADLNSREIARIMAIPEGTVRYHLSCARRRFWNRCSPRTHHRTTFLEPFTMPIDLRAALHGALDVETPPFVLDRVHRRAIRRTQSLERRSTRAMLSAAALVAVLAVFVGGNASGVAAPEAVAALPAPAPAPLAT
jgi:RNA polymerase sigma factor (sigma-70 family)